MVVWIPTQRELPSSENIEMLNTTLHKPQYVKLFLQADGFHQYQAAPWCFRHHASIVSRGLFDRMVVQSQHYRDDMDFILGFDKEEFYMGYCHAEAKAHYFYVDFVERYWNDFIQSVSSAKVVLQKSLAHSRMVVTLKSRAGSN